MSNYEGNPYNNNAGGGGFVAGGSPYGGSQGDSPGGKKVRLNTIRPLTIKQVLSASQVHADADFQVDGVDVAQVIIIGSVHNQSTSATNVSYEIGDGTGYVDVRLWLDSADDESGKTSGIEQDKYISVLGSLKVFGGKRHISATHVRLITDPNEVAHHMLKAQWVSLSLRGASEGSGAGAGAAKPAAAANDYTANTSSVNESNYAALPKLQREIMELVAKDDTDEGMHVSVVSRGVSGMGQYSGDKVMEAIEFLMTEGSLYSTIDDLHVKAV